MASTAWRTAVCAEACRVCEQVYEELLASIG
jgi:hypothetical protein